MCSIKYFSQMSQTTSHSYAGDSGPSASKIQEGDETEQNKTMDEAVELPPNGMEQGPNNVSSTKQEGDETVQNETLEESMEQELDGMKQGPNSVSSMIQDRDETEWKKNTMDEAMELDLDGMEQRPNAVSSKKDEST